MGIENFWVFALMGLMLNLTPGNDIIYVASRSTGQGVKAGVVSALGIMGGCFVHILAAVIGVSAIISQSATAFNVIKYMGAVYLIYLGIKTLIRERKTLTLATNLQPISFRKIFWQGVLTNVLNPKVALFFLAFLPQFLHVGDESSHWKILFLGTWFNISGALVNVLVALLFGRMGNWLSKWPAFVVWQERVTGIMLVILGIKVAITKPS